MAAGQETLNRASQEENINMEEKFQFLKEVVKFNDFSKIIKLFHKKVLSLLLEYDTEMKANVMTSSR